MKDYLGEIILDIKDTEFKDYTNADWALYFIERYGGYDGAHHKDWVLDQAARCLKGTPVIIKQARWKNGTKNWRINTDEPSKEYLDWVIEMKDGEDGPDTYSYEEGIAP